MARTKGILPISANFEPQIAGPFDARHKVDLFADLALTTTWQAKDGQVYAYKGMLVVVANDTTEKNGVYRLSLDDYSAAAAWVKEGGTGSINGVALVGNKTSAELGLATAAQGAKADTALQSLPAGTVIDPDYNQFTDEEKSKLASMNYHYKGTYPSYELLILSVPFAEPGDEAIVDAVGIDPKKYLWDDTDGTWVLGSGTAITVEQSINEGSVNPVSGGAVHQALLGKANQSTETVYDISIEAEATADVHLAAVAESATFANNANNASYSSSADYAQYDRHGNLIDTHYATQAELQAVEDNTSLKQVANPGWDMSTIPCCDDVIIDEVNNTLTLQSINGAIISPSNPAIFFTDGTGDIRRHVLTAPVVFNYTSTLGIWYFYFNANGQAISSQTPWTAFGSITALYRFYYSTTQSRINTRSVEWHSNSISADQHNRLHSFGTVHIRGGELLANPLASAAPNADGSNTVVALSTLTNMDDNLEYTVVNSQVPGTRFGQDLGDLIAPNLTNGAVMPISYNLPSGELIIDEGTRFPFSWNATTNVPEFITSQGVKTPVDSGRFFVYYIYVLQDDVYGQAVRLRSSGEQYTTLALAQANTWETVKSFSPTLKDNEIKQYSKLIFEYKSNYAVECKRTVLRDWMDLRRDPVRAINATVSSIIASSVGVTPVGNLAATNVQSALQELQEDVDSRVSGLSAAKTIKGNDTDEPAEAKDLTIAEVIAMLSISPAKELVITQTTFNGIAEPAIYKNSSAEKQITGFRLTSNASNFLITISGTTYTKDSSFPIALPANAELIINEVSIVVGQNIGNVILIIE